MKQTMTLAGILLAFTLCLESCGNSKSDSNTTIAENGQQKTLIAHGNTTNMKMT